jgi:outer membrane protein assembly factor BamA
MGYVEYTADADPEFKTPTNGVNEGLVDLTVTVEEGRQFRVHSIQFQGSSLADREMRGFLRIRPGDIFNQRLFEESIDELNNSGHFELIDKDKDTDFKTDEEMALLDIVIKVNNKNYDPRKHTK